MKNWLFALSLVLSISEANAVCSLDQLPSKVKKWIQIEQGRMARYYYDFRNHRPMEEDASFSANLRYSPENGEIFLLKSYWIPETDLNLFSEEGAFSSLPFMKMNRTEGTFYRFFVHPDSQVLYPDFPERYESNLEFCATATSSFRTLLVWSPDSPLMRPFFAKVSIPYDLGETSRLVNQTKVRISHTSNSILRRWGDISFLPEILTLSPKDPTIQDHGLIIRTFEELLDSPNPLPIPWYSIYGKPKGSLDESELPFLALWLRARDVGTYPCPQDWIRAKMFQPLVQHWLRFALRGFMPEMHPQNILFQLSTDGLPTGELTLRDLDGFIYDFGYLHSTPYAVSLDSIHYHTSLIDDYMQNNETIEFSLRSSLNWFSIIAAHLDQKVGLWISSGDLTSSRACEDSRVNFAVSIKQDLIEMWNYVMHKDDSTPLFFSYFAKEVMKFRKKQETKDLDYFQFYIDMISSTVDQEL